MSDNSLINTILESILKEAMGLNTSSIGLSSIKHALARRMRYLEMDNTLHYLNLLKTSGQELNELIEEVAVNETWFFRDEAPFIALRDYAVSFVEKHKGQTLKLLSLPCSTGEEPYSMAITLIEAGIPSHCFTIDAVDISRRSLAIAQKGLYRGNSFRGPHAKQHQGYFTKTKQDYALKKNIQGLVRFHRGNIIHLSKPLTNTTYQVIFCRNLLIYLDTSSQQQSINTFDSLLADNGLLIIGHAEAGIFSNSCFTPAPYPKAFAFQKKEQCRQSAQLHPMLFFTDTQDSMHQNLEYAQENGSVQYPPEGYKGNKPSDNGYNRAQLLAGQDKYDHAIRAYEEKTRKDGASAGTFYQMATLFEQKKDWQTAIKMLKKAIYLDPNYIDAINMLAAIYQRLGDENNYQTCLNRRNRIITRLSRPTTENIQ